MLSQCWSFTVQPCLESVDARRKSILLVQLRALSLSMLGFKSCACKWILKLVSSIWLHAFTKLTGVLQTRYCKPNLMSCPVYPSGTKSVMSHCRALSLLQALVEEIRDEPPASVSEEATLATLEMRVWQCMQVGDAASQAC